MAGSSEQRGNRTVRGRGPVVHLNRLKKAQMIEAIVTHHLRRPVSGLRVLDIGCGNGEISHYFSTRGAVQHGVDIVDHRRTPGDFEFRLTSDAMLPYHNGIFDVVISHHVIEHVPDQRTHLEEIRRVLKQGGIAYVATPNRSSPIMEGHVDNDLVLRYREMTPLFESCGFRVTRYSDRVALHPTRFHSEVKFARHIPTPLLRVLAPLFPSHMFILDPNPTRLE